MLGRLSLEAQLERNLPVPFEESTSYTSANQTFATKLWEDINIDAGMVALPDELVELHALRNAQRFPWDPSRSIYLLNGYHNLHCIRATYLSLQEFYRGEEQSRSWDHVLHCADAICQDILCNADDTPRYSTKSMRPESGVSQLLQYVMIPNSHSFMLSACLMALKDFAEIWNFGAVNWIEKIKTLPGAGSGVVIEVATRPARTAMRESSTNKDMIKDDKNRNTHNNIGDSDSNLIIQSVGAIVDYVENSTPFLSDVGPAIEKEYEEECDGPGNDNPTYYSSDHREPRSVLSDEEATVEHNYAEFDTSDTDNEISWQTNWIWRSYQYNTTIKN
ncbi:hypothetical protein G7Y89_g8021 [Cudoniella acicularis]|uniref:Uncharacterized protein n=1 Tax=Cudoniella acicularis TaxID=354080 RepID=A0A8H4W0Z8_9HELO|nr:hypothetical protein G7Y89_g8021 [Cudoniella acicularis]